MIVGIDPGFSGAIALLNPRTRALEVHDMPLIHGPRGKTVTDLYSLGKMLVPDRRDLRNVAIIEDVHAMPKQGVSSTFRFGQNFGALQMAITGHGYEIYPVTPAVWKKFFKLSSDKGVSRGLAMQRFPDNASDFKRIKDDGRAEAALLALYGLEAILPSMKLASEG